MVNWRMLIGNLGGNVGDGRRSSATALTPEQLRRTVDSSRLGFRTTTDLDPITGLIGQDRAVEAIRFGVSIKQPDFNLFVLGPNESGKTTAVRDFLEEKARGETSPQDWVYVNNFREPDKPNAIALPKGRADRLANGMIETINDLKSALPAMFDSEEYQRRRKSIEVEFRGQHERAIEELTEKAKAEQIALVRTETGFGMAPILDGGMMPPEVFQKLPEAEREAITKRIGELQQELGAIIEDVPRLQKEHFQRMQSLNEEFASIVVRRAIADVETDNADLPEVVDYLSTVREDLVRNVGLFLMNPQQANGNGNGDGEAPSGPPMVVQPIETQRDARFRRYLVNVLVTNGHERPGAPIVEELNPTHANLIGRIEHIARMGTLMTDFLLVKPGALHRANGGYLLIDAHKLLTAPFAWEGLKRAHKAKMIDIEVPAEQMGLITTQSLDVEPIPLNVKVVLFGDRQLYYLLAQYDPDFLRLFKVQADFEETIDRTPAFELDYARVIASITHRFELKPIDVAGVAKLIEAASRLADDRERLSLEIGKLSDIIREADFWASEAGHKVTTAADVDRAIDEGIRRADRARSKTLESFGREIMLIDVDGAKVGQINGLSVLSLGTFSFGRPSRITARVRMGAGRVVDIEREVELGGPSHSKGVMILWGYIAGKFSQDAPLALAASLAFEQSYGGVDGDSASSTELYALLSALAEVPIRQSLAVTGSVNQLGEVQAIGGVNEKIEGYFDVCKLKGLTGDQGVLIPVANIQHLMLRPDVVEAVRQGKFAVHSVATIEQGIELLTGVAAGERGKDGQFPKDTVFRRVEDRLANFAKRRRAFDDDARTEAKGMA